mgnify:CR=1 FL=1
MNKNFLVLLAVIVGAIGAYAVTPGDLQPVVMDENYVVRPESSNSPLDKNRIYYPNANISSVINKYKNGNYTGCLQELFSLTKKDPSNSLAYYYMGMAYSHLNMTNEAVESYEKAIALNPNSYIAEYATKGRDCLTGGPACHPVEEEQEAEQQPQDNLDKFINSPYGNGLSPELNQEIKQKQLNNIQQTINKKNNLDYKDIQKIRDFDNKNDSSSMENESNEKIAMVSDEEVLNAINTLKSAGVNLSFQKESPYSMNYQDPQMAELSMLLGNNNNNGMMNMVPMMMAQYQEGKNIDPRFMQAMLMNSMVTDLNFNNNNRY